MKDNFDLRGFLTKNKEENITKETVAESKSTSAQAINESKLSEKELNLINKVKGFLSEGYGDDNALNKLSPEEQEEKLKTQPVYSEGEELANSPKPLPKYNSIEELLREIETNTNKTAHEYKMNRTKEVYEALEAKVNSLEEGEHAEHIDQRALKQMRKDISTLRKAEEKLRKDFEKKYVTKKELEIKEDK